MNPRLLSRKAIKRIFIRVKPTTWDYLFDVEKRNGLHACRDLRFNRAVYRTEQVKQWLVLWAYYTPEEFEEEKKTVGKWSDLQQRSHALA